MNVDGVLYDVSGGTPRPVSEKAAPQPKPAEIAGLRKEFVGQAQPFKETRDAFKRLVASEPSAQGDLSLIFGYMRMLDPGSVVRETEFATAENAAGVPDVIRNMFNRVQTGERLNPEQREAFIGQAGNLYQQTFASPMHRLASALVMIHRTS
jgi:hypothetical protein